MSLGTLAGLYGIQPAYVDGLGKRRTARESAVRKALSEFGVAVQDTFSIQKEIRRWEESFWSRMPPVLVAWDGHLTIPFRLQASRSTVDYALVLEDGSVYKGRVTLSDIAVSQGVRLNTEYVQREVSLVVPYGYHHLHVLGSDVLIISAPEWAYIPEGTFTGVFAPLYALYNQQRGCEYSLLRDMIDYVGRHDIAVFGTLPLLPVFADDPSPYSPVSQLMWNELYVSRGRYVPGSLVDYGELLKKRLAGLRRAKVGRYEEFLQENPDVLAYARFRGEPYGYGQYLAHRELLAVRDYADARGVSLYFDRPLGVHSQGFDARHFDCFATATVGAPPDDMFRKGQDWGFHALHPEKVRDDHYSYFVKTLRHHMKFADFLRLDHVMGFHRQFWSYGVYVHYHWEEFYAVLCLESHRNKCCLIGENLGIVPREVNSAMDRHGLLGMHVMQFGLEQTKGMTCVNTHDLLLFAEQIRHDTRVLDDLKQLGYPMRTPKQAFRSLVRYMHESEAQFKLFNIEDFWGERKPQNKPGDMGYPNWRRPLRYGIERFDEFTPL
ncbi:MAG: 4-alpha-glucanotransferase [Nanobdellota archaeon]